MAIGTISTKGQITLPTHLRQQLGMKPHDRVVIEEYGGAIVIRRAEDFFALEGFLGKALPETEEHNGLLQAVSQRIHGKRR